MDLRYDARTRSGDYGQVLMTSAAGPGRPTALLSALLAPLSAGSRRALDPALALVSFVLFTVPITLGVVDGRGAVLDVTVVGAVAATCLIMRRRLPVATLLAVTAVESLASVLGVRFTPFVSNAGPVVAIAVFTVAARLRRRPALGWSAAAVAVMSVSALVALHVHPDQDQDFVQLALAVPAGLLGDAVRTRREYRQRLAAETRERTAEHDARIRAEERLRISRDVHDVVSHTLSMIAVRSGVARMLIDSRTDEARSAPAAIETASRTALDDLRTVLRHTGDDSSSPHADDPSLAGIVQLADNARDAGLAVDHQVSGQVRGYEAMLETSAYRVVQESLTNVMRHAQATTVRIEIRHDPAELCIRVADDGRAGAPGPDCVAATPGTRQGLGLNGMRERLELFGGTLEAGPRPTGGFTVVARFPTSGPPAGNGSSA